MMSAGTHADDLPIPLPRFDGRVYWLSVVAASVEQLSDGAGPIRLRQMGPRGNPVASRLVKEADVF